MKSLIQITFIIVLVSCGGGGGGSSSSPTIPDGSSSTGTSQSTGSTSTGSVLQLQQHLLQQLQQQAHITQTYQLLEQLPCLGILIQIN